MREIYLVISLQITVVQMKRKRSSAIFKVCKCHSHFKYKAVSLKMRSCSHKWIQISVIRCLDKFQQYCFVFKWTTDCTNIYLCVCVCFISYCLNKQKENWFQHFHFSLLINCNICFSRFIDICFTGNDLKNGIIFWDDTESPESYVFMTI